MTSPLVAHDLLLHAPDHREQFLALLDELCRGLELPGVGGEADLGERQLVGLLDAARAWGHHEQLVAEEQGLFDAVGDQDDGLSRLLPELEDQALHLLPGQGVERAQRFVHQDDLGLVGQASGQRHPLLHATREFVDGFVAEAREADRVEQAIDQGLRLGPLPPVHPGPERHVLGDVLPLEEGALLEDHAPLLAGAGDRRAAQFDRPAAGGKEPGDDVEQRRLATTRWSQQRQQAAGLEVERNVVQGLDRTTLGQFVDHAHVPYGQVLHRHSPLSPSQIVGVGRLGNFRQPGARALQHPIGSVHQVLDHRAVSDQGR